MKTIEQLLRELGRPDVLEVALVNGRLPCVRIGTSFDPIDHVAPEADQILEMLFHVGGSRYVDDLGRVPRQWTSRVDGVGVVSVSAVMPREGEVQARFALARRDERAKGKAAGPEARRPTRPDMPRSLRPEGRTSGRPSRGAAKASARRSTREKIAVQRRSSKPVPVILDKRSLPPPTLPAASEPSGRPPSRAKPPSEPEFRRLPTAPAIRASKQPAAMPEPPPSSGSIDTPRVSEPPSTAPATWARLAPLAPTSSRTGPETVSELELLLKAGRDANASDMHLVAGRPMLLRIAGDLKPRGEVLDAATVERMLLPCVPPRLCSMLENDGSCDFALSHDKMGRFRVSVSRQQTGLKATVRFIARDIPTLERLGLPLAIAAATKSHQGLIVITGPTGHGKTSTLAAIVDILNRETASHIITVEDPIEFVHARKKAVISQREIGSHTRSFATALKAALREDPDVIVVGELRDTETVRMAVAASETGHLVLGTMNTPSAAKTIDRLIDLFPPADQPQVRATLAAGLRLIVSQRLVPSADRTRLFAAAELLPGSVPLSALIRENKTFQIPSLQQRSKALGIVRLDDSLVDLVQGCYVALDVAKGYAEAPNEIDALLATRRAPRAGDESSRQPFGR
jgi:twitching motility protein PilT